MKTQLLEDIGQSTSSLVASSQVSNAVRERLAPAGGAGPAKPRTASSVWRQKPAGEAALSAGRKLDQQAHEAPTPSAEAPGAPPDPNTPASLPDEGVPPAPALDASSPLGNAGPPDPVFDFSPRSPPARLNDAASTEPSWFQRSGQRYLLWGACLFLAALVLQGSWWLYGARKDAGSLALVASEVKDDPQLERAAKRRAMAAKEFTLGPDGEVRVSRAAPAPATQPLPPASPPVPPLVVLEAAPGAGAEPEQAAAPPAGAELGPEQTIPAQAAEQSADPTPEPARRSEREQPATPARKTKATPELARNRQSARPAPVQAETAATRESTTAATLKACRAHGYHAAQCIKRACSVTKYGFVCRGK